MELDRALFDSGAPEADTLAGFILERSGKIPKKNEVITYKDFRFAIESVDNRRIQRVKITVQRKKETSPN